jgi:hypothetical protein
MPSPRSAPFPFSLLILIVIVIRAHSGKKAPVYLSGTIQLDLGARPSRSTWSASRRPAAR